MTRREWGFTLAEVLVAATIVTIGLAGIASMLQLAATSSREGRHRSAATFLANERVEQLHGTTWDTAADCLGVSPSASLPPVTSMCSEASADPVSFPDERAGTLRVPFEAFSRTVRVQPCASLETCPVASHDLRLVTIAIGHGQGGVPILTLRGLVAKRL
ncbi:MAG: type IV pilus modification PilV family protein [Candidatus Rokuibacteriota bacterium]